MHRITTWCLISAGIWAAGCADDDPAEGSCTGTFATEALDVSIDPESEFHHRWAEVCGQEHQTLICLRYGDDWTFYIEKRELVSILSGRKTLSLIHI